MVLHLRGNPRGAEGARESPTGTEGARGADLPSYPSATRAPVDRLLPKNAHRLIMLLSLLSPPIIALFLFLFPKSHARLWKEITRVWCWKFCFVVLNKKRCLIKWMEGFFLFGFTCIKSDSGNGTIHILHRFQCASLNENLCFGINSPVL